MSRTEDAEVSDAISLVTAMRDDGLAMKANALAAQTHLPVRATNLIESDDEEDRKSFLKGLSTKQKQKLLR